MQPAKRPDPKSPPPEPARDQVKLEPILDVPANGCSGAFQNCKKRDKP